MLALRTQILEFPHGALKDRLDALAYAVKQCYPPVSEEEEKERAADLQARREAMGPYTKTQYDYGGM
jgi:hypothetical protein